MKNIYSVTVLLNGDVFGVWSLAHKPTQDQRIEVKRMLSATLKELEADPKDQYSIQFSDNIECENFSEVVQGIKESIENHINYN